MKIVQIMAFCVLFSDLCILSLWNKYYHENVDYSMDMYIYIYLYIRYHAKVTTVQIVHFSLTEHIEI